MIRLEGIERKFEVGDQEVLALDGIDERIERGEYVAIMGSSGSGKSTLLNILGCLDRPSGGRYWFEGDETSNLDDRRLTSIRQHRIGFVFQSFHLVPRLTAAANIELPLLFAGTRRRQRKARVDRGLAAVGLSHRADHRPDQLSGGERQRIAIARSMVMDPPLLLADEPTGNLDTKSGRHILDVLESLRARDITLVVVTHDPGVAARADRILLLRDGRIVERAPSSNIAAIVASLGS